MEFDFNTLNKVTTLKFYTYDKTVLKLHRDIQINLDKFLYYKAILIKENVGEWSKLTNVAKFET